MSSDSVHNDPDQFSIHSPSTGPTHQDTASTEDTVGRYSEGISLRNESLIPASDCVSEEATQLPHAVQGGEKKMSDFLEPKNETLSASYKNRIPLRSLDENVFSKQKYDAWENALVVTMMEQRNSASGLREDLCTGGTDVVACSGPAGIETEDDFASGTRDREETDTENTEIVLGTKKSEEIDMCNSDLMSCTAKLEDTDSKNNDIVSGTTGQEDGRRCILRHVEMTKTHNEEIRHIDDILATTIRKEQRDELIDVAGENSRIESHNVSNQSVISACKRNRDDFSQHEPNPDVRHDADSHELFIDNLENVHIMNFKGDEGSEQMLSLNFMEFVSAPMTVGVDTNTMKFDDGQIQVCNTSNKNKPQALDTACREEDEVQEGIDEEEMEVMRDVEEHEVFAIVDTDVNSMKYDDEQIQVCDTSNKVENKTLSAACLEESDVQDGLGDEVEVMRDAEVDPYMTMMISSGGSNEAGDVISKHETDQVQFDLSEMFEPNICRTDGLCPKDDVQDCLAEEAEAVSNDTSHRTDSVDSKTDPTEIGETQKDPIDSLDSGRDPTESVDLQTVPKDSVDSQTDPVDNVDFQTDPTDSVDSQSNPLGLEHVGLPFEMPENTVDIGDQLAEPWDPAELQMEDAEMANPVDDQSLPDKPRGPKAASLRAKKRKKQKAKLEKYLAKYTAPRDNRKRKYAASFKELLPSPEDDFHPDFTCPVCLDLFHKPHVVSPCQHMFCEPCLRKLPSSALADIAVCPLCRCDIRACSLDVDLHLQLSTYYSYLYNKRARQEKKLRTNQNPLPRLHTTPLTQQIIRQIFRNSQSQRRNQTNGCLIFLAVCMSAVLSAFYVWLNIPIEISTGPLRNAAVSNIWIQAMCLFVVLSWLFAKLLQTFAEGTQ